MPRNTSTHAAGVVITRLPVYDYVPLATNDDTIVTEYTMTTLEELGLLKMDFLSLRNITVIDDAIQEIRKTDPDFSMARVTDNDPKVMDMLTQGKTSGVFQMESSGMTGVCVGLKPQSIEDLSIIVAAYRPGPMDSIPRLIACKNDPKLVQYKHPMLEPILSVTYGCILYQEQVLSLIHIWPLIQDAGLKGRGVGGAKVSEKHVGFVVNFDHATAADVRATIALVQKTVYETSGVRLEPEVRIW